MGPIFPFMFAAGVAFWGSVLYLALRFVRAAERRSVSREELTELTERVRRLEEELVAADTEIERLAAAERFNTQLLASRVGGNPGLSAPANPG
jgi:hypothetical protein